MRNRESDDGKTLVVCPHVPVDFVKIGFRLVEPETNKALTVPDWVFTDAVRYAMGRMSTQVSTTCDWLIANWARLPVGAQAVIRLDLEMELVRDNVSRERGGEHHPLGHDCDRKQWDRVWNHINSKEGDHEL